MSGGTLTNRIRTLRFLHGEMSQSELGHRIGVTRQTIAAIESGKYPPSLEAAFRIAHVFHTELDDVFQWVAPEQDAR
jgi:putative transcriptional regulator